MQINVLDFIAEEGARRIASMGLAMAVICGIIFLIISPNSRSKHADYVSTAISIFNNIEPTQAKINQIKSRLKAAKQDSVEFNDRDIGEAISGSDLTVCKRAAYERYTKLTGHDITAAAISSRYDPKPETQCLSMDSVEFDQKVWRLFSLVKSLCQERLIKCR